MEKYMPVKAASDSIGAQLSMMRKRSPKKCENSECGKKFTGLTVTSYCSDECRFRAAYLRRKEDEVVATKTASKKARAKEVVRKVRL